MYVTVKKIMESVYFKYFKRLLLCFVFPFIIIFINIIGYFANGAPTYLQIWRTHEENALTLQLIHELSIIPAMSMSEQTVSTLSVRNYLFEPILFCKVFGSFGLSTKEPYTIMLCPSCVIVVGTVIVGIGIIYAYLSWAQV